jgi:hypothetical protein
MSSSKLHLKEIRRSLLRKQRELKREGFIEMWNGKDSETYCQATDLNCQITTITTQIQMLDQSENGSLIGYNRFLNDNNQENNINRQFAFEVGRRK